MDTSKIGENLDRIRAARGMSKAEMARLADVTPVTVGNSLKTGRMDLMHLLKYIEVLGCSGAEALDGAFNPEKFTLATELSERYPWNLGIEIIGREDAIYRLYIPALNDAIETLTDREQRILVLRFKHGWTLEEVGKEFGVTRDRIRQIQNKAIRRLRHPSLSRTFLLDTMGKYVEAAKERDRLKLENITLQDKLDRVCKEKNIVTQADEDATPLYDLELSVRSYNCLARAGYTHLGDLRGVTVEKLMKVRNLGRKSMKEVVTKLKEYGIEVEAS